MLRDWKTKRFLINCIEAPLKKKEYYHNGSWFILGDSLPKITEMVTNPLLELAKEKKKTCISCDEKHYDALGYDSYNYQEYERYLTREHTLILPSSELMINYFELKVHFNKKKEKEIIERIEMNVPRDIRKRSEYYDFHLEHMDFLKRGNLKINGHFTTCYKHSSEESINSILKGIAEASLGRKQDFYFHPWLGNSVIGSPWNMNDFLSTHYDLGEINVKVLSSETLENRLSKDAYLSELKKI